MKKLGRRISIYTLCISTAFIFLGCTSDSNNREDVLNEFSIKSAVYDNNRTETVADDILYVYFNKSIDFDALLSENNISDLLKIDGNGSIDTASIVDYTDTFFHRLKISLGAASNVFDIDTTKISLAASLIDGFDVSVSSVVVNAFRPILKTGQTVTYTPKDDGEYQKGITRSYTDNGNGTVKDNATGLIWEKEDDNNSKSWIDAVSYCTNLNLGNSTNWRVPSIEELAQLVDRGTFSPLISSLFTNTDELEYWSNSIYENNDSRAWELNFSNGRSDDIDKTNSYRIRCVY